MGFESREVINQDNFVASADELLAKASEPRTSIAQAVEAAQEVNSHLDRVATGKLEVQPPLSDEQIKSYTEKSSLIISLGNKATAALEDTGKGRRLRKTKDKPSAAFQGGGSLAKS